MSSRGQAGRPRDPTIDSRIFDAAMELYALTGWTGFTFEGVARASGVGKGALYRRWADRAALLGATIEARWEAVREIDTGHLRDDFLTVTLHMLGLLNDNHAGMAINLQMDARRFVEVRALAAPIRRRLRDILRAMLQRAAARGEIAAGTSTSLVGDVLIGAITNHVLSVPEDLRDMAAERQDAFATALVDLVMNGIALPAGQMA